MLGELLDREHDRQHRREGQADAGHVDAARARVTRLGQQHNGGDQEDDDDRHVDEEDRSPPEVLEQPAANHGTECGATGEHRCPGGDRESTVVAVVEDVADKRQRRRHQGRAEDTQQRARCQQRLRCRAVRSAHRSDAESDRTDQQQLSTTDAVAEAAHRDQQSGEHQRIDVDKPQHLLTRGVQRRADLRQREAQHGVVDRGQEDRHHQHRKGDPLSWSCAASVGVSAVARVDHRHVLASFKSSSTVPAGRYRQRSVTL